MRLGGGAYRCALEEMCMPEGNAKCAECFEYHDLITLTFK